MIKQPSALRQRFGRVQELSQDRESCSSGRQSHKNLFAKAVQAIVIAKKFSRVNKSESSSPIKPKRSLSPFQYANHLEPAFSENYRFTYSAVVDAAIEKYSPNLAKFPDMFHFPSTEVNVSDFKHLYRDYSLMTSLKERDRTSPERRVAWSYADGYKPSRNGDIYSANRSVNFPQVSGSKNFLSVDNANLGNASGKSSSRSKKSARGLLSPVPDRRLPQLSGKRTQPSNSLSKTSSLKK